MSAPESLSKLLNQLKSVRANFQQSVSDTRGNVLQKTSGNLILQRPGQFRWEVTQPSKQLLVADGQRVWFYDVDLQQVTVKKQPKAENSPIALLSESPKNLTKNYVITFLMDVQGFYLMPKDKNALFRSISLIFKANKLREMRLLDKLDQETVIDFDQVEINPKLRRGLFHFVVPKDKNIEVIQG
jgi:outer membrane lipoprotein carrier protein